MANSQEKYQLVLEAREAAADKIKKLNKQVNDLGGPAMVKSQKEIKRLERNLKTLNTTTGKSKPIMSKFVKGIALGNIVAMAAAKSMALLHKAVSEIAAATKVAARIEVLNHVMEMTGQNAGYTMSQLRGYKQEIMGLGIAESEALAIQQRFIQSQLDVADATKIARAAQDLAVIAGVNSSEAALGLTDALVKQRPILLKQYGIIADLDKIYNQQAETLGKTRSELTETEKRQGFLNEILRQSKSVAGAYETAMRDAGKQITSLPRYYQEAQKAIGQYFLPVMGDAVSATKESLKFLTKLFQTTEDATAKFYASVGAFDAKAESTRALAARYDELTTKTNLTVTEQHELEGVMRRLLAVMPEAASAWDETNRVIGVNTDRIRNNLEAKRALLRLEEADKIQEWKQAYEDLGQQVVKAESALSTLPDAIDRISQAIKATESPMWAAEQTRTLKEWQSALEATPGLLADFKNEQHDLIIALSQGFDVVNDYDRTVSILGKDLADTILALQKTEEAVQGVNAAVKAMVVPKIEFPKFEGLPQGIDIEGKFIVSDIGLPDESQIDTFAENLSIVMKSRITEPFIPVEAIFPDPADTEAAAATINAQIKGQINADIIKRQQAQFTAAFAQIGRAGVDRLATTIASGRGKISDVFKGMYEDFMAFFIKKAIASIANMFIPGLGALLGGIFDTPKYDRLAMEQGEHFAHYFTQGVFSNMRSGSEFMRGIVPNAANMAMPSMAAAAPAASPSGATINVTFSGNVLSSEFIEDQVAPTLRRLSTNGKSDLALNPENITGGRNVRVY